MSNRRYPKPGPRNGAPRYDREGGSTGGYRSARDSGGFGGSRGGRDGGRDGERSGGRGGERGGYGRRDEGRGPPRSRNAYGAPRSEYGASNDRGGQGGGYRSGPSSERSYGGRPQEGRSNDRPSGERHLHAVPNQQAPLKAKPVPADKLTAGLGKAKEAICSLIFGLTQGSEDDFGIAGIEVPVSFSENGTFLGFGEGGAAHMVLHLTPPNAEESTYGSAYDDEDDADDLDVDVDAVSQTMATTLASAIADEDEDGDIEDEDGVEIALDPLAADDEDEDDDTSSDPDLAQ